MEKEEEAGETGKMGAMGEMEKKKEGLEEKMSGGIRDEGKKKKEKEKEPDREKMEERKETDNLLPVGGILRGNPFSCLPPGFGIGCPPVRGGSQEPKGLATWRLGFGLCSRPKCGRSLAGALSLALFTRHQYILFPLAADGPSASPFRDPFS